MRIRFLNIILLLTLVAIQSLKAQENDTIYKLDAYVGAGYGYYVTDMDLHDLNRGGVNMALRVMWQPEHILSVGIHTGYMQLYTYELENAETEEGVTDINSRLTAVPIGLVFAMKITEGLSITGGTSAYIISSFADSHGNEVYNSSFSIGSMLSLTYTKPLSSNLSLGGELRYSLINSLQDGSLSLQAVLKYTFLEY